MNLKELREQLAKLKGEIRRLADVRNSEGMTQAKFDAEHGENWKRANADHDELLGKIQMQERAATVEAAEPTEARNGLALSTLGTDQRREGGDAATAEDGELILRAWMRTQMRRPLTERERDACQRLRFDPSIGEIEVPQLPAARRNQLRGELRASHHARHGELLFRNLSAFTGNVGGYVTLPPAMIQQLEINLLAYGGVEQVAEVMTTSNGNRLAWPTADDTSNTGVQLGEGGSIGSSVDPSFNQIYWDAYKFSSKPVLVPYELFEDTAFDVGGWLGAMLGERLGRISNTKFTTGTGADTCKGLVTSAAAGITAASATAISADEALQLTHSIDPAYRSLGCGFMMHDGILLYIRQLKDGQGRYLFDLQAGLTMGVPDRLFGYPITINQDMQSTVATGTVTMLFGQFSKYKIRRVGGVRMYHLRERYRDQDMDAFIAFLRQDGNLLTAGTAPVKKLTQA